MTGVGTMGVSPSAFPASIMRSIHHRTITACITAQRLLNTDPLITEDYWPPIEIKKIMARIRITEEAIADLADARAFVKAARAEFHAATHSWVKP